MRSFDLDSLAEARRHAAESSGTVGEVHAAEAGGNEPESTMSEDDGEREELKGVFAVRDGSARFVEIETGIADQKRIEIIGGLTEGDTVIAGPYRVLRNVKDGDALKAEFKDN